MLRLDQLKLSPGESERLLRKKIPREWNDLAVDIVVTEERALRIK